MPSNFFALLNKYWSDISLIKSDCDVKFFFNKIFTQSFFNKINPACLTIFFFHRLIDPWIYCAGWEKLTVILQNYLTQYLFLYSTFQVDMDPVNYPLDPISDWVTWCTHSW